MFGNNTCKYNFNRSFLVSLSTKPQLIEASEGVDGWCQVLPRDLAEKLENTPKICFPCSI